MQSSDRPRKIDDDLTSRLRGLFAAVPGREAARVQRCHRRWPVRARLPAVQGAASSGGGLWPDTGLIFLGEA